MTRGWKIGVSFAAAVVALNLALAALRSATGGTPGGPTSSSYATGADGDAAYASLLLRAGHDVEQSRKAARQAQLLPSDTAVILDPPFVDRADVDALVSFVAQGGRLIASEQSPWLRLPLPALELGDDGRGRSRPFVPIAELAHVREVVSRGGPRWRSVGAALPALGDRVGALLAVASLGRGRVYLLADSSPLQNRFLGDADNAALGLGLAGAPARRVVFFESYHGYGRASGLGVIPVRWRTALILEAIAVLTFMVARGRRLGPPESEGRGLPPSRAEYVRSLATTLRRTRDRREALLSLRSELRRRIALRAGLPGDASDDALGAAAMRLGLEKDEVDAALAGDDLALGRVFAHTESGRRQLWTS
jgi:hypothetical protein